MKTPVPTNSYSMSMDTIHPSVCSGIASSATPTVLPHAFPTPSSPTKPNPLFFHITACIADYNPQQGDKEYVITKHASRFANTVTH